MSSKLTCLLLAFFPMVLLAQEREIRGTITDDQGIFLSGITVSVKGKSKTLISNALGVFSLTAAPGDVLVFSSVNYEQVEVPVDSKVEYRIKLQPKAAKLDDIVVIGYGVQKKVNLTGAVAMVKAKDIENRPITNLSSALTGLVPGAYISQSSGVPGSDGASIQIRGKASLSSTSPLILIDGIIGNINSVNPQDVESVSVLKDAASVAIYGAQGGSGVVLITTKKGNGPPKVNYSGIFSSARPIHLFPLVSNSAQFMRLINQGFQNVGAAAPFDSVTIQGFADAAKDPNGKTPLGIPNYVAYPNTNWPKYIFTSHLLQNHNISVNGGNETTRYLLSIGYFTDPGLAPSSGYSRYSIRANVESKLGKSITVGTQTYGTLGSYGLFNNVNLLNYLTQTTPTTYPYYDGKYGFTSAKGDKNQNLYGSTNSQTGTKSDTYINTTWYGKVDMLKGLSLNAKFNYTTDFVELNSIDNPLPSWNFLTMVQTAPPTPASQLNTYSNYTKTWSYTLESALNYAATIAGKHNISAFVAFNQYYNESYNLSAQGYGLIDPSVTAISSASTFPTNPSGSATNYAFRSVFGRVNYNYGEKYLFEANLRNDASSRFGPDSRHGNFPSVSVGWNLAKESFLSTLNVHHIQSLKLRASWGQNGNSAGIGNYQWQGLYAQKAYAFNGVPYPGVSLSFFSNPNLQWETLQQIDLGLDAVMFHNFEFSVDWFRKSSYNILFQPVVDITAGTAGAPTTNLSKVGQNGLELSLGWHDKAGAFSYSVSGNFTCNYNNRVIKYKGPLVQGYTTDANGNKVYNTNIGSISQGSNNRILEGHMIDEFYLQTVYHGSGRYTKADGSVDPAGGPKSGMIRTPQDLTWVQAMQIAGYKFAPVNTVGASSLNYGDLVYADNDGDGTYGDINDARFMHINTTPRYIYGLAVNTSWKNFDLSMIWAGASGFKYLWNTGVVVQPGYSIYSRIADNHYYYNPNNPGDPGTNLNGLFPRLKQSDNIDNVASDFWFYSASYIKLKNLQVGYTFPQQVLGHIKKYIKGFRVYFSGENLLLITKYPGADPEEGPGTYYPLLRQYSLGINATF